MRRTLVLSCLLPLAAVACGRQTESKLQQSPTLTGDPSAADPVPASWDEIEQRHLNPDDYELAQVATANLDKHMTSGSAAQGVPANLQGIWWMDGNLLAPGSVTSFAKMLWDLPHHRVLVQEYGDNNYTYDDDDYGRKSFAQTVEQNLIFEVTFNADYTQGRLIQVMNQKKVPIAEVDYTIKLESDGTWLRKSAWKDKPLPDYHLRRVIDAQGQRVEPAYSEFSKIAPVFSLIPRQRARP